MTWELGSRLREARRRLGMTQHDVADGIVSAAFLSMVESGRREPSPEVLDQITKRLGLEMAQLEGSGGVATLMVIRTALARAKMLVDTADFAAGLHELDGIARHFMTTDEQDLRAEFHHLRGRLLEGVGRVDDAIRELIAAVELSARRGSLSREIEMSIDLSRCLRSRGDLSAALDWVTRIQDRLPSEMEGSVLHGQLIASAIGLYVLRGDYGMAQVMADRAQAVFTTLADPRARAYVMWNASLAAEANADSGSALLLATEAAKLLAADVDQALLGRLHTAIAILHTRVNPPDLLAAAEELHASRAAFGQLLSAQDAAMICAEESRVRWLQTDFQGALEAAEAALAHLGDRHGGPLAASAHLMMARAQASLGDTAGSRRQFALAQERLDPAERSRTTAIGWRELGDVYLGVGMGEEAVAAYQLALTDAGLTSTPVGAERSSVPA